MSLLVIKFLVESIYKYLESNEKWEKKHEKDSIVFFKRLNY